MPRELAHEDRDVEMRAETAQVPRTVLVRCTAQSRDVRLKVERRAVHVPNADGTASGPERMDHPGWYGGDSPAVSVCLSLPTRTSSEPLRTGYSSFRRGCMWG